MIPIGMHLIFQQTLPNLTFARAPVWVIIDPLFLLVKMYILREAYRFITIILLIIFLINKGEKEGTRFLECFEVTVINS